jgi:CRISPR/Cas system CSM-associated protein Csm3 (group 7 of RAMP superfamily)
MALAMWSAEVSRKIRKRIVVEGDLVLQTPTHFGNGDGDDLTDMPLLLDPYDEAKGSTTPLLTGASIAGAMRGYLREVTSGYRQPEHAQSASTLLFGGVSGDDEGFQSPLIVGDALGKIVAGEGIEMRDGVRISPQTRTAEDKAKFDIQLWQAGTKFKLLFELLVCKVDSDSVKQQTYEAELKQALATALQGFSDGGITLGARKHRGYGRIKVDKWRAKEFDLTTPNGLGLIDWLENDGKVLNASPATSDPKAALNVSGLLKDLRKVFRLEAEFTLDGSLLIRAGNGQDIAAPDMTHLQSLQAGGGMKPVMSGTSLGGALRARATRIANTIERNRKTATQALINTMFGDEMNGNKDPHASRIVIEEHIVEQPADVPQLVLNRVSIDRFTGGARDTALFNEQPVFGGDDTVVRVNLSLINPAGHEIGLLLLLLKDLWTSDLPLGGESSVGRGRLNGQGATMRYRFDNGEREWRIARQKAGSDKLAIEGDRTTLEMYVSALRTHLGA